MSNSTKRLRIEEDEPITKPFNWSQFVRLLRYIKPYRRYFIYSFLLMILATFYNLAGPYLIRLVIDIDIPHRNIHALLYKAVFYIVLTLLYVISLRVRTIFMTKLGNSVVSDIRMHLFTHLQKLSLSFFDSRPAGKIMVRVMNDVDSLSELLSNSILNVLVDTLSLWAIIVIMLSIDIKLSIVALGVLPLLISIIMILKNSIRTRWQDVRKKSSTLNAYIHESIQGMKITQAFTREEKNAEIFKNLNTTFKNTWMKAIRVNNLFWPTIEFTGTLSSVLIFLFGIWMMRKGYTTLGTIIAFSNYMGMFWQPINNISNFYNQLLVAMASTERIFEILDIQPDVQDDPDAYDLPPIRGEITFENVSFSYDEEKPVLKDVSFTIKAGETIALVGETGAGKTTIINLIARFYDPQKGRILIDGHDIKNVTLNSLRKQMGIMLQDTFIFSGTIADNIRYAKPEATMDEVISAAKIVNAHEFIMKMEKGYDTEVNERGSRLSIGQRQLIAFARALLADPKILILDEATSAVDTQTEVLIQQAIEKLTSGRTSIIIAHRLSTIRNADRIFVIHDGQIVEEGNHEQLIEKKGYYYNLYTSQFKYFEK
ncbi:ATP-binding cassette subfamily B protein [Caldicellulosiruptor bescii]|uniref:ABC transporter related n=2 Tax=Caldicellulosiruptor bescii TaxID=31899 RepID=B9MJW6_CALBD|nr:ABC transporter ATP-binding protein [Caldicellulosiruptor bescii]ACM60624.1 ABC transporter related [Caldicellulosiruptor bescii DSM 6725]PBC88033.1 ATP-binding cassette subfamily B protein [Caldicellulosiruptor bescii]PBC90965.1 ATP-binding cassette subfamily B protein [Caldicellulosiruptor bescii]PBD03602.1 ATP-binding cassette subfamily B protein [Caldicellulosiruptor bescii]PBD06763.1 ATP-binding cassette subfamily B protein [Caldicellulosiruptor bescii]